VHGESSDMPMTSPKTERSLCQPIPGARPVFRDKDLLEAAGRIACKRFGTRAEAGQKLRHVSRLCEAPVVEIVAPAVGDGFSLAGKAVEFESLERKAVNIAQEYPLFLSREKVRLISHAFR
jgi:hypothetical protein